MLSAVVELAMTLGLYLINILVHIEVHVNAYHFQGRLLKCDFSFSYIMIFQWPPFFSTFLSSFTQIEKTTVTYLTLLRLCHEGLTYFGIVDLLASQCMHLFLRRAYCFRNIRHVNGKEDCHSRVCHSRSSTFFLPDTCSELLAFNTSPLAQTPLSASS